MLIRRASTAAVLVAALLPILAEPALAESAPPPVPKGVHELAWPERQDFSGTAGFDPTTVLVRYKPGVAAAARSKAITSRGARVLGPVQGSAYIRVRTEGSAEYLVKQLRKDPSVASVALDHRRRKLVKPNDPGYTDASQRYLDTARFPQAWDLVKESASQVIAIVDTGVDRTHPDLAPQMVGGYNAIDPAQPPIDGDPEDTKGGGHGTMVAGIAAAKANNGQGVAGAAWNGRIMPVKVFADESDFALDSDIVEGITWAADHGAKVINLSLGAPAESPVIHDAVKYAVGKGAVIVAAAGNSGGNRPEYPAAYPEVLAVGATDHFGTLDDFSTWGDWVDVAAPGSSIVSTYPLSGDWDYAVGAGTSFSAPIVSGLAALIRTKYPTWTPAQVQSRIKDTARDAGPRGLDPYYGAGFIDAFRAVGGAATTALPLKAAGSSEPNDVPARATVFQNSIDGTLQREGDVDWFAVDIAADQRTEIKATPPTFNPGLGQNADVVLRVYDTELRQVGISDGDGTDSVETVVAALGTGRNYISVENYNGSPDGRNYKLEVAALGTEPTAVGGEQVWVRNISPADFGDVTSSTVPEVTFVRPLDPESAVSGAVRLLDGRNGAAVAVTPSYTPGTNTVKLTPNGPLMDGVPYRISVGDVKDTSGVVNARPFSTTFATQDTAPGPVTGFTATGGTGNSATLSWTLPAIGDLDQVIIRGAINANPPASPTTGTAVYAGTGTSVKVTGIDPKKTYRYRIWVKDRSGKLSDAPAVRVIGSQLSGIVVTPNKVSVGEPVTVTGKIGRADDNAGLPAGEKVQLETRVKGTAAWLTVATAVVGAGGALSAQHQPQLASEYRWVFPGSGGGYLASVSGLVAVSVRPVLTAELSAPTGPVGTPVTLSGIVTPALPGAVLSLDKLVNGAWVQAGKVTLTADQQYSFTITPAAAGTVSYRVSVPAAANNLAAASNTVVLTTT